MEKNIAKVVSLYITMELILLFALYKVYAIAQNSFLTFATSTVLWNVLLFFFLLAYKQAFYNVNTHHHLNDLNLANKITLIRISTVPLVGFILRHHTLPYMNIMLLIAFIGIFLTDFIDGRIARKYNQVTKIGQMLDSVSDYALVSLIGIIYYQHSIVPIWLFILIMVRLIIQTLGICIFTLLGSPMPEGSTIGGKITISVIMLLYTFELMRFFSRTNQMMLNVLSGAEYVTGVIVFLFTFEKIILIFRHQQQYLHETKNPTHG